jgi:hypothetical protein
MWLCGDGINPTEMSTQRQDDGAPSVGLRRARQRLNPEQLQLHGRDHGLRAGCDDGWADQWNPAARRMGDRGEAAQDSKDGENGSRQQRREDWVGGDARRVRKICEE